MSREPRKLIDLLVAVVVVALAVLGFARPVAAYPAGKDLTINTKAIYDNSVGKRVELIVRHAVPRAMVRVEFENRTKSKRANSRGIAVFSFVSPRVGRHVSAAYSQSSRASATVYLAHASLLRVRAAVGSTNYVTVKGAKPGAVITLEYGSKTLLRTVDESGSVLIDFKVPEKGTYNVKVFAGKTLIKRYKAGAY